MLIPVDDSMAMMEPGSSLARDPRSETQLAGLVTLGMVAARRRSLYRASPGDRERVPRFARPSLTMDNDVYPVPHDPRASTRVDPRYCLRICTVGIHVSSNCAKSAGEYF